MQIEMSKNTIGTDEAKPRQLTVIGAVSILVFKKVKKPEIVCLTPALSNSKHDVS